MHIHTQRHTHRHRKVFTFVSGKKPTKHSGKSSFPDLKRVSMITFWPWKSRQPPNQPHVWPAGYRAEDVSDVDVNNHTAHQPRRRGRGEEEESARWGESVRRHSARDRHTESLHQWQLLKWTFHTLLSVRFVYISCLFCLMFNILIMHDSWMNH